jgi:hypothetical protein
MTAGQLASIFPIWIQTWRMRVTVHITLANEQERAQVAELPRPVQHVPGQTVNVAFADQDHTGGALAQASV